jgi:hypothetical protein
VPGLVRATQSLDRTIHSASHSVKCPLARADRHLTRSVRGREVSDPAVALDGLPVGPRPNAATRPRRLDDRYICRSAPRGRREAGSFGAAPDQGGLAGPSEPRRCWDTPVFGILRRCSRPPRFGTCSGEPGRRSCCPFRDTVSSSFRRRARVNDPTAYRPIARVGPRPRCSRLPVRASSRRRGHSTLGRSPKQTQSRAWPA